MQSEKEPLKLPEYKEVLCPADLIKEEEGVYLFENFGDKVSVDPPTFKTDHQWRLVSNGWVGHIPVSDDLSLSLVPKVELGNLFGMLEYAYNLRSFEFLDELFTSGSIEEFYDRLANVLANRVLGRARKGLYRTYIHERDSLPYLRGTLDLRSHLRRPWSVNLPCHFQEHTPDIEENQILAWTLMCIARSGSCTDRSVPVVRRAFRAVQTFASLQPFSPEECVGRLYNRLNQDYEILHALCRFFLENSGPTHEIGERRMLPFLVNMARLYERFVAEWITAHRPPEIDLHYQEAVHIGTSGALQFNIDIVLYETATGSPMAVLDTKYKTPDKPSTDDVAKLVAYAEAKHCKQGVLIYPAPLPLPFREQIGTITIRSATFDLSGDLDLNGAQLVQELLQG